MGNDIHPPTPKLHQALAERKKRIVAPPAHVAARKVMRAALANDNHTRFHGLPAVTLDPAKLRITVSTVPRGTLSLLVSHNQTAL